MSRHLRRSEILLIHWKNQMKRLHAGWWRILKKISEAQENKQERIYNYEDKYKENICLFSGRKA